MDGETDGDMRERDRERPTERPNETERERHKGRETERWREIWRHKGREGETRGRLTETERQSRGETGEVSWSLREEGFLLQVTAWASEKSWGQEVHCCSLWVTKLPSSA